GGVVHAEQPGLSPASPMLEALPPVSAQLETELKRVLKERGLVLWLDADANYAAFVDALSERAREGAFPFPVLRFDGSYLELMLALEGYGNELYPEKVLVYLPQLNKTSIADTPLYELYKAGRSFEKALDTLIEEACVRRVRPEEGVEFRKRKPSLQEADAWLTAAKGDVKNVFLIGLEHRDPASVLSELFTATSSLVVELDVARNRAQFLEYLERQFGLPSASWKKLLHIDEREPSVEQLRTLLASWLMAVE